VFMGAVYR